MPTLYRIQHQCGLAGLNHVNYTLLHISLSLSLSLTHTHTDRALGRGGGVVSTDRTVVCADTHQAPGEGGSGEGASTLENGQRKQCYCQ